INVHTGVAATDQGMITGRADETLRVRALLCPQVRIFADVHVKHAVPVNQPDIALAAEETAYRGRADAIIVSGATTGRPVDQQVLAKVKAAVPDKLVLVGSGASADTIAAILGICDGAIVGSSLKPGGDIAAPVDAPLAEAFIRAAKR
ncbi:MAG TPA: BtpA/SgcQ family protein, partial [Phycisphaerae bacterium]|nr:BtpA/SgcQ family protein [Phycisphaerae bacterium]